MCWPSLSGNIGCLQLLPHFLIHLQHAFTGMTTATCKLMSIIHCSMISDMMYECEAWSVTKCLARNLAV